MAKKRFYGSSRNESRDESGQLDHSRPKFNDKDRGDQFPNDGFLNSQSEAQHYMGMPASMRSGLEKPEMIYEDPRAIANLPQEVMIKPYPKTGPYLPEGLDDSLRGIDQQMDFDDSQRRRGFFPKKV
jgi:hypothetical protein